MNRDCIVPCGYMGSGSSAVTDLLREYEHVICPQGAYEYIFLHCPGGVFDLEDKLLRGNSAIRSDEALRVFRETMAALYRNEHWWFGGYEAKISKRFMEMVDAFIADITTCAYEGFWYEHQKISKARSSIARFARGVGLASRSLERIHGDEMRLSFPTEYDFHAAANAFLQNVINEISREERGRGMVLLDQLFLPHNLYRADNYLDEARFIVVQRDPRDVFLSNKYVWAKTGNPVPLPFDVEVFCECYSKMRQAVPSYDSPNIKEIWFEDLILDYDSTVEELEGFLGGGIGKHAKAKCFLKPEESACNIGIYAGPEKQWRKEAEVIAAKLGPYLYQGSINEPSNIQRGSIF